MMDAELLDHSPTVFDFEQHTIIKQAGTGQM
jgi:hypothetical protein